MLTDDNFGTQNEGKYTIIEETADAIKIKADTSIPFVMLDRDNKIYSGLGEFMKKDEIRTFENINI